MACILVNKDGDEITRYGFISHMEDYLKSLLKDPAHASPDDYLCSHGVDGKLALSSLLKRMNPEDENSAVLIRKETIKTSPEGGRDIFSISYKVPRKDYIKKMRNLYMSLFENHIASDNVLDEMACGGGAVGGSLMSTAADSGQYDAPFGGKKTDEETPIIKRTIYIREDQLKALKEEAVIGTPIGDFGYDAPIGDGKNNKKNKFFEPANDHESMMAKSWNNGKGEKK